MKAFEFAYKASYPIRGTFNLVTSRPVWKAAFAFQALSLFEFGATPIIDTGILRLPRPTYSVLSNRTFCETFDIQLPTVTDDLHNEYQAWKSEQAQTI